MKSSGKASWLEARRLRLLKSIADWKLLGGLLKEGKLASLNAGEEILHGKAYQAIPINLQC